MIFFFTEDIIRNSLNYLLEIMITAIKIRIPPNNGTKIFCSMPKTKEKSRVKKGSA